MAWIAAEIVFANSNITRDAMSAAYGGERVRELGWGAAPDPRQGAAALCIPAVIRGWGEYPSKGRLPLHPCCH